MKITCFGSCVNGEKIWIPAKEINAVYQMNISGGDVHYIGSLSNRSNSEEWHIRRVIEYGDEVFFFSMYTYKVWCLNEKTNELKEYSYSTRGIVQITNIEVVQNKAWIIANNFSSPIICFDLQKKEGSIFQWDNKQYLDCGEGSFTRTVNLGDKLYFATRKRNDIRLCMLDCKERNILIEGLDTFSLVNCIGIYAGSLWVFGEDRHQRNILQEYDLHTLRKGERHELSLAGKLLREGGLSYVLMVIDAENVILIPAMEKKIILYNLNTKKEKYVSYPNEFGSSIKNSKTPVFFEIHKKGGFLYFMPHMIPQIIVLNIKKMSFDVWDVEVPGEEYAKAIRHLTFLNDMYVREERNLLLSDYCKIVEENNSYDCNFRKNSIGANIYLSV